jgi:hypothetical protein
MTSAFKGMGTEIKEDWKASGDLADRLDALEDKEIALINSLEERKAKAAELRLAAKEELEDQKKKLDLLNQAEKLYKTVYGDQIALEQERLALMKEQLAMQTKDPTDEQRKAVAEQEAKISALYREQAEQLKGLNREKRTALALVNEQIALEKAKSEQIAIQKADISNIKLPDFSQVSNILAPLAQASAAIKQISIDLSTTLESSFESAAVGLGEFLGQLMTGGASFKNFTDLMAGSFAELAITVGKLAIQSAITVGALNAILKNPANWPIALAAGVALVALGTAIRGSLSSAASGGSGGGSSGTNSSNFTYDTRQQATAQSPVINIQGELVARGADLVYVFGKETNRKKVTT